MDFDRFELVKMLVQGPWIICRASRSFLRWLFFGYIVILLEYGAFWENQLFRRKHARHQVVFKSAMGKLTPGTVRSFHVCLWKRLFTLVNLSQIGIFEGDPYFAIYCLINSFFYEHLLWQSVLIFSYIGTNSALICINSALICTIPH